MKSHSPLWQRVVTWHSSCWRRSLMQPILRFHSRTCHMLSSWQRRWTALPKNLRVSAACWEVRFVKYAQFEVWLFWPSVLRVLLTAWFSNQGRCTSQCQDWLLLRRMRRLCIGNKVGYVFQFQYCILWHPGSWKHFVFQCDVFMTFLTWYLQEDDYIRHVKDMITLQRRFEKRFAAANAIFGRQTGQQANQRQRPKQRSRFDAHESKIRWAWAHDTWELCGLCNGFFLILHQLQYGRNDRFGGSSLIKFPEHNLETFVYDMFSYFWRIQNFNSFHGWRSASLQNELNWQADISTVYVVWKRCMVWTKCAV